MVDRYCRLISFLLRLGPKFGLALLRSATFEVFTRERRSASGEVTLAVNQGQGGKGKIFSRDLQPFGIIIQV